MDHKLTMLRYVEYCAYKKEEAAKEYAKYNGFISQVSETMRENNLDYMQMGVMAEATRKALDYWNEKFTESVKQFENLFDSREDAYEYSKVH